MRQRNLSRGRCSMKTRPAIDTLLLVQFLCGLVLLMAAALLAYLR